MALAVSSPSTPSLRARARGIVLPLIRTSSAYRWSPDGESIVRVSDGAVLTRQQYLTEVRTHRLS